MQRVCKHYIAGPWIHVLLSLPNNPCIFCLFSSSVPPYRHWEITLFKTLHFLQCLHTEEISIPLWTKHTFLLSNTNLCPFYRNSPLFPHLSHNKTNSHGTGLIWHLQIRETSFSFTWAGCGSMLVIHYRPHETTAGSENGQSGPILSNLLISFCAEWPV